MVEDPGDDGLVAALGQLFGDDVVRIPPDPQLRFGRADLVGHSRQDALPTSGGQHRELYRRTA
jgi:hypothetical protein